MQLHQMAETVVANGVKIIAITLLVIVKPSCANKPVALSIVGDVYRLVIKTVKAINNAIWVRDIAGFEPAFPRNL
ncbi:hypothetical protein CCL12_16850 [Pseudomonas syringae]|nr:hypothetical protein CCL12_16475 [Pseudomonas syringae]PBP32346.1 hypothetical protein CCL12_16850 [Pseudomonas syringae]